MEDIISICLNVIHFVCLRNLINCKRMEAKGELRVEHPAPNPVSQRSPWGIPVTAPEPCSLAAVMDEEFAKTLQIEEEQAAFKEDYM